MNTKTLARLNVLNVKHDFDDFEVADLSIVFDCLDNKDTDFLTVSDIASLVALTEEEQIIALFAIAIAKEKDFKILLINRLTLFIQNKIQYDAEMFDCYTLFDHDDYIKVM